MLSDVEEGNNLEADPSGNIDWY